MDGNVQGQAVSAGFPFASLTWTTLEAWIGILLSALPGGTVTAGIGRCLYESAGIFLFYAALRILAGRIPAVTVTAVLALQPLFPAFCEDGGLFLTAAGLLLLAAALYLKKLSWGKAIPAGRAVFCGLTAGAAFFLDPAFLSFLILPVWASAFVCGAGRAGRRAVGMLLVCLSATVGFFRSCGAGLRFSAGESGGAVSLAVRGRRKTVCGRFPAFPECSLESCLLFPLLSVRALHFRLF